MIGLNIVLIIMTVIKSTTYISIGMMLTGAGIVFTLIGTLKQGKENDKFQSEITESSKKNIALAEKLAEQAQLSSDKLEKQNEESTNKIVHLSDKNAELTQKLTDLSEDRFRRLTIPVMNVLRIEEVLGLGINSYFKIIAKNTGNNDCQNARLIIDRHNSPLVNRSEIQSFVKVPKDVLVEYKIPRFQSDLMERSAEGEKRQDFETNFLKRFMDGQVAIVIFYHFEYEWKGETLRSSQFSIVKSNNEKPYGSSSDDYVEPEDKTEMPKWKK